MKNAVGRTSRLVTVMSAICFRKERRLPREALGLLVEENREGYARVLSTVSDEGLASDVVYTNQMGRTYRTRADDILIHVTMHGPYHRGQIAAAVRAAGGEPISTDYITYVRELAGSR